MTRKVREICGVAGCEWHGMAVTPGDEALRLFEARDAEWREHMHTHTRAEIDSLQGTYVQYEYVE